MAYEVRFPIETPGSEKLDQVAAKIAVLKAQVASTGTELRQTATRLADANKQIAEAAAAGHTALAKSLQGAADAEAKALDQLVQKQRLVKAALGELTRSTEDTTNATQRFGRMMELAYNENRARDLKKITDAAKAHAKQLADATAE